MATGTGTYLNSKGEDLFESARTLEVGYLHWPIIDALTEAKGEAHPSNGSVKTANRIVHFAEKVVRA